MTDMIQSLVRRDPRYRIKDNAELKVTIERRDGSSCSINAELLDLSVRGAKFKAKEAVAVEDVVCLKIEIDRPKRIIAVSGRIRWVTPIAGDDWWLGCVFDVPIEFSILHELAVSGILERRRHRRDRISVRTTAKWELNSTRTEVCILDYSPGGGFCMLSQSEGKPGDRVLLRFESKEGREVLVCGTARWQVESEEGYVIGCEFLHTRNAAMLSELIESNSLTPPIKRNRNRRRPLSRPKAASWVAAAALVLLALGLWWGRQTRWTARKDSGPMKTVSVSRTSQSQPATLPKTSDAEREDEQVRNSQEDYRLWQSVDPYALSYGLPLYVAPRPVEPYADSQYADSHQIELPLLEIASTTFVLEYENSSDVWVIPDLRESEPSGH